MPAPESVSRLIEQFREHLDAYKSGSYNETQLRREFLDPFFAALGWDVFNTQGYAGDYKDVVHEAAIKIGGTTKAPDYSFRIGGQRKFFVEAKKPSVDVKGDPHPAYQLRRYAWTAGLPLSVLSDFEEFAVYDGRVMPEPRDKASTARILYMTFEEYEQRWDEIESVFSKTAILKGAFDKFASKQTRKRGTAEPDDEFLKLLEGWRAALAQNIARNNELNVRQINHAVQLIIDRIVFLRICEDRGVEVAGTLQGLLNGTKVYDRLLERFRHADGKYNSGLFHFNNEAAREAPDTLTPSLEVGDKVLKDIIRNLYYPTCPYELSVLPADILGHIYERFLGSVITLSPTGKTAKVEEKPEVRKAGGVYYTPTYIVEYIVEHTVGELLKDRFLELKGRGKARGPAMNKPLRVLDPACGSGSFLLGAYDHLLEWHLRYYTKNEPDSWATLATPPVARRAIPDEKATHSDWKLTTHEKKRILTDHIFGVDIDAQAVEVTKLSLLLKVLEGENEETLQPLLFAKERALPDLSDNIRCGNSLIGSDFYAGQQGTMFDEEEQYRINAFDWDIAFREIMESGGFDAVIGNPPYIRIQTTTGRETPYLSREYTAATGNFDVYCLFLERSIANLATGGRMALIVPHRFFKTDYGRGVRELLAEATGIIEIIDFDGFMVFESASINTAVLVIERESRDSFRYVRVADHALPVETVKSFLSGNVTVEGIEQGHIAASALGAEPWAFVREHERSLWSRLSRVPWTLADATDAIFQGLKTGADSVFIGTLGPETSDGLVEFKSQIDDRIYEIESSLVYPLVKGGQMRRYSLRLTERCILFPYSEGVLIDHKEMVRAFPSALEYLERNRRRLEARDRGGMKGPEWYGYSRNQALLQVHERKILVPDYYSSASYCLDWTGRHMFCGGGAGGYGILPGESVCPHFLLGCLNSRVVDWYLKKISMRAYQTAYMYTKKYLTQLPIRPIDQNNPADVAHHDRIVDLVRSMLDMNERLHGESGARLTPQERRVLEGRIASTDREIDRLVYDLYGLTEAEIVIVEEATAT